jgi:hypothetical protein
MNILIRSRTNHTLFEGDFSSLARCLEAAIEARADLHHADLGGADLSDANLRGANLRHANLRDANLSKEELAAAYAQRTILPEGDLIGYKKLAHGAICKVLIPAAAKRVGGMTGRKCRAEWVEVLDGEGVSSYDKGVKYAVGAVVRPSTPFDDDVRVECASGIHFFITRTEAENY